MKLKTRGTPLNIQEFQVLKVTRFKHKLNNPSYCLIIDSEEVIKSKRCDDIVITTSKLLPEGYKGQIVYNIRELDHISEDDILYIGSDGVIKTLYRVNSRQNMILLTERCNSNCLMCSQPPKDIDDIDFLHNIHLKLIPLIPKNCNEINLTGGEPTLLGPKLIELLNLVKLELPSTEIHILTNGRLFSVNSIAKQIAAVNNPRMMLGIPLYSDFYQIHDYVVQSKDAFYQTVMGIHNLKRYNVRIEIRVVLHKITIPRLQKLSEFIYKNLPFVDQVVFMGLEIMGFTKANLEDLWIDPIEYIEELDKATSYLHRRKIKVSIYNTPLCILPQDLWFFSKKSISDWKNIYFPECVNCAVRDKCGGLFASSASKHSNFIKSFDTDPSISNEIICV